jgi:hypothetical protein
MLKYTELNTRDTKKITNEIDKNTMNIKWYEGDLYVPLI